MCLAWAWHTVEVQWRATVFAPSPPGLHPVLQAQCIPLHRPPLGPAAGFCHCLRHYYTQAL